MSIIDITSSRGDIFMADYCGNCAHYDLNQKEYWGDRYYCTKTCKYKESNDKACYNFVERPEKGYQPAGCFITTAVCEVLGYSDDCEILLTLRNFREKYLKTTKEGRAILQEYDQIGPIISYYLRKEPMIDSIILTTKYIIPCVDLIKKQKYFAAVLLYISMVQSLKEKYKLTYYKVNYSLDTPDHLLGKARLRKTTTI